MPTREQRQQTPVELAEDFVAFIQRQGRWVSLQDELPPLTKIPSLRELVFEFERYVERISHRPFRVALRFTNLGPFGVRLSLLFLHHDKAEIFVNKDLNEQYAIFAIISELYHCVSIGLQPWGMPNSRRSTPALRTKDDQADIFAYTVCYRLHQIDPSEPGFQLLFQDISDSVEKNVRKLEKSILETVSRVGKLEKHINRV